MNFKFRCNSLVIRCKARNTKTANKIIKMLRIKSSINTWADAIEQNDLIKLKTLRDGEKIEIFLS
jgi:division protein CdvB (Snf7/Vps24/ESCRT-III family)